MPLHYTLDTTIPDRLYIGKGMTIPVSGWCFHDTLEIRKLSIAINKTVYPISCCKDYRYDIFSAHKHQFPINKTLYSGFYTLIPLTEEHSEGILKISLIASYDGKKDDSVFIGEISCQKRPGVNALCCDHSLCEDQPLIAICMATFNPQIERFEKQIQSIIDQTYKNWILIINDDKSDERIYEFVKNICSKDRRISIFQNSSRLGFYRNFETALRRICNHVKYVALSDQDDYWYPYKLSFCLKEIENPEISLVYSDMRIVKANGEIISNTYWKHRKNHSHDISLLLLANTITGAATLFRKDLLEDLLPFPSVPFQLFHDQWIGLISFLKGSIAYIDEPLYDYIQHNHNVLGHRDFKQPGLLLRIVRRFQDVMGLLRNFPQSIFTKSAISIDRAWTVYRYDFRQLQQIWAIIEERFRDKIASRAKTRLFHENNVGLASLFLIHIKNLITQRTTNQKEWRLFKSRLIVSCSKHFLSRKFIEFYISRKNRLNAHSKKKDRDLHDVFDKPVNYQSFIEKLMRPLKLDLDPEAPVRFNLLISEINPEYVFGGYIAMFNFAQRLAEEGAHVRIVVVDRSTLPIQECKALISGVLASNKLDKKIEICFQSDRQYCLWINPLDVFIATSCWTAHIAHEACKELNQSDFLFLIQEYEPYFQPMGTYYALAKQAYSFPHSALFSTRILMDFFKERHLGVFNRDQDSNHLILHFENALQKSDFMLEKQRKDTLKKILIYARPEAHATRNMFELAVMSINSLLERNLIDPSTIDIHGIGSNHPSINLAKGKIMTMLGKVSLDKYRKILPTYDVGIAFMYTPHPSLLPLEMAAAGLITITNTCLNKTMESMSFISSNILAVEPTIASISDAFLKALSLSDDYALRWKGSHLNWSFSWEKSFSQELTRKIIEKYVPNMKPLGLSLV